MVALGLTRTGIRDGGSIEVEISCLVVILVADVDRVPASPVSIAISSCSCTLLGYVGVGAVPAIVAVAVDASTPELAIGSGSLPRDVLGTGRNGSFVCTLDPVLL